MLLRELQALLAGLYDAPAEHDVHDFLITDAAHAAALQGAAGVPATDEQLLVAESADGLELFFTRLYACNATAMILVARRSVATDPFGEPRVIGAIAPGIVEAPTLTPDGKTLYYHRLENGTYTIFKVSRP